MVRKSSSLKKNLLEVVLKIKLNKISNLQMIENCKLLENIKKEKFIHHSNTIFGVLIQLICN